MIKAVFFDLYHTLLRYEPPREELLAEALWGLGIDVKPEALHLPMVAADEFIYEEIACQPLGQRSEQGRTELYAQHQRVVLEEAGIEASEKLVLSLLGKMRTAKMKLVLFDDVLPALTELKRRGLVLGLISNVDRDITSLLADVGLSGLLSVVVTSQNAGVNKPQPGIFQTALERAGIQAAEAVYVGDQYRVDVGGAKGAGLKGVLLDRNDYYRDVTDAPRIHSLSEMPGLLESI
ncbi:MAG: HAD-IA family hydrolase [Chloroflexota bacterium]